MAYRVRTESFEGPFDLLLYLVNRQRVDIGAINIARIADQYLDELMRMQQLDLDVASDFLVVAATLLEIKAASLVPSDEDTIDEEIEELAPNEARDILLSRLLDYKQYKNAAAALDLRYRMNARRHPRTYGAPAEFLNLFPDFLENIKLPDLAAYYVACYTRRDKFLLESEHIASRPIAVESYVRSLHQRIRANKTLRFSEAIPKDAPAPVVVVSFLAVLELVKRNMVRVRQRKPFGDFEMSYIEGSGELAADLGIDEYGPHVAPVRQGASAKA